MSKKTSGSWLNTFLKSRRQGLSSLTTKFYNDYLHRASAVIGLHITSHDIGHFLDSLSCVNGGKPSYYRVLKVFYNWLYSPKSGYGLRVQDNPILLVESPKVEKKILPSLTPHDAGKMGEYLDGGGIHSVSRV